MHTSWILLLLCGLDQVSAYICSYYTRGVLRPQASDGGEIESPNYPSHYGTNIPSYCQVEIVICPGCSLTLTIQDMSLKPCLSRPAVNSEDMCDQADRCDYLMLQPEGHSPFIKQGYSTNDVINVTSSSLTLRFCFSTKPVVSDDVFPGDVSKKWKLSFTIIDSYTHRYEGSHDMRIIDRPRSGTLWSPRFPVLDPARSKAMTKPVTYLIHGLSPRDCVTLTFSDFDLCGSSVIIIYDGANRTALKKAYRKDNQYPHLKSSGQYILLEYLHDTRPPRAQCMGFKADYQYVRCDTSIPLLDRECVAINSATGGAAYQEGHNTMNIDCVWLLYTNDLTMALRFIAAPSIITGLGESTPLIEIRNGPTSNGKVVFATRNMEDALDKEFTSEEGLYLRLRGAFPGNEHVAFVYNPFRQLDGKREGFGKDTPCGLPNGVVGFTCHSSQRCVPDEVCCDGVQHCADAEDEHLIRCRGSQPLNNSSAREADCFSWGLFWCDDGHNCFSTEQRCDGVSHCADNADELFCGSSAYLNDPKEKPKPVWWLAIPVGILCVVLLIALIVFWRKQRRGQMIYRCGVYTPQARHIQMHTFNDDGLRSEEEGNLREPLQPLEDEDDDEIEEDEGDEIWQESPHDRPIAMETISIATREGLQLWGDGEPLML